MFGRSPGERIAHLEGMLAAYVKASARSQDKLEADIVRRFTSVNEFRTALDELGKGMATRRELEVALEGIRGERNALVATNDTRLSELTKQVGDLRSRMDTGPSELRRLRTIADRSAGEHAASTAIIAYAIAGVTVLVSVIAVVATLLTR